MSAAPPGPELELPSSPPPIFRTESSSSLRFDGHPNRKRQWTENDNLSSDPIFSDDTSGAEGCDAHPRRKRIVKGPWWTLRKTSDNRMSGRVAHGKKLAKKAGLRNADSGVWLGSDSSDVSCDSITSSRARLQQLAVHDLADNTNRTMAYDYDHETPTTFFAEMVILCVEHGQERIDLSYRGITYLSSDTLKPLHQLIRPAHTNHTQPPSEEEFTPLLPSLKLFLSSNNLTSLPSELFSLEHLTVLSLRNNQLTSLPPFISNLKNLTELNISGNDIRYLPWELLPFLNCPRGSHNQISVRPNPLFRPSTISGASPIAWRDTPDENDEANPVCWDEGDNYTDLRDWCLNERQRQLGWTLELDLRSEMELRLKVGRLLLTQVAHQAYLQKRDHKYCREQLIFLVSSGVRYIGVDGAPCRTTSAWDNDAMSAVIIGPTNDPPESEASAAAPSLFELALRSVQNSYTLTQLRELSTDELAPRVSTGLEDVALGAEYNNESCSTCGQHYVIARALWFEYWFFGMPEQEELTQESVLPFLRKACSWACAVPSEPGTVRY